LAREGFGLLPLSLLGPLRDLNPRVRHCLRDLLKSLIDRAEPASAQIGCVTTAIVAQDRLLLPRNTQRLLHGVADRRQVRLLQRGPHPPCDPPSDNATPKCVVVI